LKDVDFFWPSCRKEGWQLGPVQSAVFLTSGGKEQEEDVRIDQTEHEKDARIHGKEQEKDIIIDGKEHWRSSGSNRH
jgi:hypothetical protein